MELAKRSHTDIPQVNDANRQDAVNKLHQKMLVYVQSKDRK